MILAQVSGTNDIEVTWSGPVDVTDFNAGTFTTESGSFNPQVLSQGDADLLVLSFAEDITGENVVDFAGVVTGVLSPDSITIT